MSTPTTQATAKPWKVLFAGDGTEFQIIGADNLYVARINRQKCGQFLGGLNELNASLIVQAVNQFDALNDAVKVLESIYNADRTKNNGAYMGEAKLCGYFQDAAKRVLENLETLRSNH